MRAPQGRLTDIFSLPSDDAGAPRTVIMLDRLTHVPDVGDVLHVAGHKLEIMEVGGRRIRSCLTTEKLAGRGDIAVLVNEPFDMLRELSQRPTRPLATWTPKSEVPWHLKTEDLPIFTHLNADRDAYPNGADLKIEQTDVSSWHI